MAGSTSVGAYHISIEPKLEKGSFKNIGSQLTNSIDGAKEGKSIGDKFSEGFTGGLSALKVAAGNLLSNIAQRGIDMVLDIGKAAIEASDATDKFKQTLNFGGIDSSQIDALTASCRKYADETVYDLSDIQSITAQLAANNVKDFDKLAEAAGNLNAAAGGSADTYSRVGMVLTQTAGAGKLTAENWNQLADAIPGASGKLQEAMLKNGAYTGNFRDAMAKGEISAEEFNQAIMDLGFTDAAEEAAKSTSTIEGAMGNLEASILGGLMDAFDLVKPYVTDFINFLADGIGQLPAFFAQMGQAMQPAAEVITNVAQGILDGLSSLFGWLSETFGPFFMDILLPSLTECWENISELVTTVIDLIGPYIEAFLAFIQPLWDGVWGAIGSTFSAIWSAIQTIVETVMGIINGVISTVTALIQGDWEGVWSGIQQIAQSVWDGISGLVQVGIDFVKNIISNVLSTIKSLWENAWNAVKDFVLKAWDGIKNGVKTGIDNVVTFIKELPQKILEALGNLGSLLLDAGKSVIDGFLNGLKAAWDGVTGWIGGIGDWIASHKGPLDYDRRLLIPHGKAIISGLNEGMRSEFGSIVKTVSDIPSNISMGVGVDYGSNGLSLGTVNNYTLSINGDLMRDPQALQGMELIVSAVGRYATAR